MVIKAVCYGEVLWDVFPNESRIGGAPLNVASRLSANGIETALISQVGDDQRGKDILNYLSDNKVGIQFVKTITTYPTGAVNVTLSNSGSASYEIAYPVAWDKIGYDPEMSKAVEKADVFIFGSLVCRNEISRTTLYNLLEKAKFKVFDINLRPPHYQKETLSYLMQESDFIKFNDEELLEVSAMLGSNYTSLEQNLHFIAEKTHTSKICVTKGAYGAVLLTNGKLYYNSGYKIKVKDTVGAGDSFLASLIAKIFQNEESQMALDYACAVGALVAGCEGANPQLKEKEIELLMFPSG